MIMFTVRVSIIVTVILSEKVIGSASKPEPSLSCGTGILVRDEGLQLVTPSENLNTDDLERAFKTAMRESVGKPAS